MEDRYHTTFEAGTTNHPHRYAVEMVGSGRYVLEVGCWNGHVTEALAGAGNRVVGVDVDADQLAANRYIERGHHVDLDTSRLSEVESDRFDVIVLGDVLEHLRRPEDVLADLVTLLADDGRLVISVPNVSHVDVRLHLLAGRWEYQEVGLLDRTHLRWFTRASLRELLASVGFVARRLETVVHPHGASQLALDDDGYPDDALRYVATDPDATVYQFVVEASRDADVDALAPVERHRIDFGAEAFAREQELAALRDANTALRNRVDALERSRAVRVSRSLRGLLGRDQTEG